jgi:catechol 2,3-dioxygenase-like lactoylglutathione lyase family enzyme
MAETSIYSSNLEKMKEFYVDKLGLDFVSEHKGQYVVFRAG